MTQALARPVHDPSAGEVGGIFAGIVAVLVAIGHGIKWTINWNDARATSRAAKLDAREVRLRERETEFEEKIEARMAILERENRAYRLALSHVIPALSALDPGNASLHLAEEALRAAFPLSFRVPGDMRDKLDEMP